MFLNNNKIVSLIDSKLLTNREVGNIVGTSEGTIRNRRVDGKWSAEELYKLSLFFEKSIYYFFDRDNDENINKVEDDESDYHKCKCCLEKQKEIDRLNAEINIVKNKYINLLESSNNVSQARECG